MKPLTEPMLRVLVGIGTGPLWFAWYPAGQRRMILQGLMDRGLIDRGAANAPRLTDAGREVLALVASAEVVDVDA